MNGNVWNLLDQDMKSAADNYFSNMDKLDFDSDVSEIGGLIAAILDSVSDLAVREAGEMPKALQEGALQLASLIFLNVLRKQEEIISEEQKQLLAGFCDSFPMPYGEGELIKAAAGDNEAFAYIMNFCAVDKEMPGQFWKDVFGMTSNSKDNEPDLRGVINGAYGIACRFAHLGTGADEISEHDCRRTAETVLAELTEQLKTCFDDSEKIEIPDAVLKEFAESTSAQHYAEMSSLAHIFHTYTSRDNLHLDMAYEAFVFGILADMIQQGGLRGEAVCKCLDFTEEKSSIKLSSKLSEFYGRYCSDKDSREYVDALTDVSGTSSLIQIFASIEEMNGLYGTVDRFMREGMAFLQCCENEIIDEFPDYRKTNFGIHYMTDAARMLDSL